MHDPFARASRQQNPVSGLVTSTLPSSIQTDVVQALEDDLRSEKKAQIKSEQSQQLGGSGAALPDVAGGMNRPLLDKARRYAMVDNVPPPSSSVLGDFNRLLRETAVGQVQNSGQARNQLMAMAFSSLENTSSEAQRITESQMTYDLAAASYGLNSTEEKGLKKRGKMNKFLDAAVY